jgi:hypothetical protein
MCLKCPLHLFQKISFTGLPSKKATGCCDEVILHDTTIEKHFLQAEWKRNLSWERLNHDLFCGKISAILMGRRCCLTTHPERWRDRPCESSATDQTVPTPAETRRVAGLSGR